MCGKTAARGGAAVVGFVIRLPMCRQTNDKQKEDVILSTAAASNEGLRIQAQGVHLGVCTLFTIVFFFVFLVFIYNYVLCVYSIFAVHYAISLFYLHFILFLSRRHRVIVITIIVFFFFFTCQSVTRCTR